MKFTSLPLIAIHIVCPPLTVAAHHNVVLNRYTEPRPFFMNTTREISKQGFKYEFTINMDNPNAPQNGVFFTIYIVPAPGQVRMVTTLGKGTGHIIEMYISPATPGFCNMCTYQVLAKPNDGKVKYTGQEMCDRQIKVSIILIDNIKLTFNHDFYSS